MYLRLLPALMVVAALALVTKVGGLIDGFQANAAAALAAEKSENGESMAAADEADSVEATLPSQKSPLPPDPFELTDQEIDLLQALAQRREELDLRSRDIDQREVMLSAAEIRINEKIGELEALKATIKQLLEEHKQKGEEQMLSLVKIYESMKPKDAARIFEQLDMPVLLGVIELMKERKSAPILAQMDPQRAKAITIELAQRRDLPIPLQ